MSFRFFVSPSGIRGLMLLRWLCGLLLLLGTLACQEEPSPEPPLVLQVGARSLNLAQFERELQHSYPDLSSLPETEQRQLKEQLVARLVEREMIQGTRIRAHV